MLLTEQVSRMCMPNNLPFPGFDASARDPSDLSLHVCSTGDFCNGAALVSKISTKMALLPLSVLLMIYIFSR
jgi:hypothetical protein